MPPSTDPHPSSPSANKKKASHPKLPHNRPLRRFIRSTRHAYHPQSNHNNTSPDPHHTSLHQQQTDPKHSPNTPPNTSSSITSSPISSHKPNQTLNHTHLPVAPTPSPPASNPDNSSRTDDPVALAATAAAAAAEDIRNNPPPPSQTDLTVCSCCSKFIPPHSDPSSSSSLLVCRTCCAYVKSSDLALHYRLVHASEPPSFPLCASCLHIAARPADDSADRQQRMFARENVPDPATDPAAFAAAAAAHAAAANDMSSAGHPHLVNTSSPALASASLGNGAQNQFGLVVSGESAFNPAQQNHLFDSRDQQQTLNSQNSPVFALTHPDDQQHAAQQGQSRGRPQGNQQQQAQQVQQVGQLNRKVKRGGTVQGRQAALAQAGHQMVGQHHIQAAQSGQPDARVQQVRTEQMYQQDRSTHAGHVQQSHAQMMPRDGSHQPSHMVQQQQQQQQQSGAQHHGVGLRASTGSFSGTQIPEQSGSQFGFDDVNRRRQALPPSSAHPTSVMLGFSDNYMQQQQDAINDGRSRPMAMSEPLSHQQRDFQPRFDGDPGTMVQQTMTYDIKEENMHSKRMLNNGAASATAEAVLTSNPMDHSATDRAVGAPLPPNMVASRSTVRTRPDGRPIASSAVFIHGTVEKRVTCDSCGLLFGDLGSLKRHAARAHRVATGKGPVYCSQCNASLKNEQNLRRHIAVCHSGDQKHRCEMCTASFSSRGSLRIHQQQVHAVPSASSKAGRGRGRGGAAGGRGGSRARAGISKSAKSDKSYVCDMCTDTFKWKGNLKRHRELRHLHLRPFVCEICNANFGTKSNMRVHLITHSNSATQAQK